MKKLLVATDLSSRSDRAILRAIELAKNYNAKLTILHIVDNEMPRLMIDEAKESAIREIKLCIKNKTKNISCEIEIIVGNPHREIVKFASKSDFDLIILGIHRHIDSGEPLIGKVIERVIKNSSKPVLVVKNRSEFEYKNILAAIDFNIHSKKSLKLALKYFAKSNFNLVHSYQIPFLGMVGDNQIIEEQIKNTSLNDLRDLANEVINSLKSNEDYKINLIVKKGFITDALNEEISYIKPELLVFGSNGRTGISYAIVGSVTEKFLINPPCDVLVAV